MFLTNKNIVLLETGSFNPPTNMHLRMFGKTRLIVRSCQRIVIVFSRLEIARDHLTRLGYTVCGGLMSPTHDSYKKKGLVTSSHRCAMIKRSLVALPWIQISDWEAKQNGWTRTREVLQYHQVNDSVNSPMSVTFLWTFYFHPHYVRAISIWWSALVKTIPIRWIARCYHNIFLIISILTIRIKIEQSTSDFCAAETYWNPLLFQDYGVMMM